MKNERRIEVLQTDCDSLEERLNLLNKILERLLIHEYFKKHVSKAVPTQQRAN